MYTSPAYPPAASPYHSPPPDPYRASPISMAPKQPYSGALSPPPNAFSPMSSGQPQSGSRYANYAPGYARPATSSRFQPPYPNGQPPYPNGQPQQGFVPQQPQQLPPARHKGTLAPGQIVQVGDQAVRIERYLSEGGYAHVYLTSSERPIYPPVKGETKKGRWGEKGYTQHCLKRIAFEDESVWVDVRKEIEVMKSLPPNPHLVQYLGSAHSRLPSGGYEVFILMEFCSGGGIIDLLNKRLRDRLTEIEILNIFTDVCEAVAAMHAMSRPLLHRDLKIENVLSSPSSSGPTPQRPTPLTFKLCDFGSTTFPASHTPQSKIEADALAMDLNKHTTLQYRSPEMVEPMLGWAVGLPSDVWALGVLLYKLCYYTTPFEEHGTLAIVNAKYTFPQYPVYSPRLQHLIASMLLEQPQRRPTVFEILKTAHEMSGTRPEIDYPTPSRTFTTSAPQPPKVVAPPSSNTNLLDFTSPTSPTDRTPVMQPSIAASVQPQRRGRPTRETSKSQIPTLPQPPQISQPTPPVQPQPQPSSRPSQAQPAPASGPSQNTEHKLQVTGDKEAPSSVNNVAGTDAFGMPASFKTQPAKTGFGDSFGTLKSPPTGSSSFGNSFGTLKSPPTGSSRYSASLQGQSSGFGDSFSLPKQASKPLSPKKTAKASTNGFDSSFAPKPSSPQRKSPDPSSSIPDGELSFETRFPSLEALDSDDGVLPLPRSDTSAPAQVLSPDFRPSARSRPSMLGNMTGGDLSSYPPSGGASHGRPLQPRSTNVTGTAFKAPAGGMLSSSPVNTRKEYFEAAGNENGPSKAPQDLMTGDDEPIAALSLRPTLSTAASSTSAQGLAARSPEAGHSRRLSSQFNSSRQATNINDPEWSPLEEARKAPPGQTGTNDTQDSSDEEAGPEDASGHTRPQTVRTGSQARPLLEPDTSSSQSRQSPIKPKSSSTPVPPSANTGVYRPPNRRILSHDRSRPQSMIALPSGSSSSSLLSPPLVDGSGLPRPSQARPSHVRKGSITEMVERYENLQVPSSGTGLKKEKEKENGLARKPSVAVKPAALRKSIVDDKTDKPTSTASSAAKPLISPNKPSPSTVPPSSTSTSPEIKRPMPIKAKPEVAKKPNPNPNVPGASLAYSRSSSGRTFPVATPKPSTSTSTSTSTTKPEVTEGSNGTVAGSGTGQGQGSPEKQQPVNLLIARWNQGQVGAKDGAGGNAKRGGYI